MAKSKIYKAEDASNIKWPKEEDLAKIREELSSDVTSQTFEPSLRGSNPT